MYGYTPPLKCPNCGHKGWKDKVGYECEKCGNKKVDPNLQGTITLVYCNGCGCTLSGWCDAHPHDKQHKVKL